MTEKELLSLKEQINEAKDTVNQLKGRLTYLNEQLKKDISVPYKKRTKNNKIMKINVSIEGKTVELFNENKQSWEKCNFEEAGVIYPDKDAIEEYFTEEYEGQEIEVVYI